MTLAATMLMTRSDVQRGHFRMGGRAAFVRDDVADAIEQSGRLATATPREAEATELLSVQFSITNGCAAWRARGAR